MKKNNYLNNLIKKFVTTSLGVFACAFLFSLQCYAATTREWQSGGQHATAEQKEQVKEAAKANGYDRESIEINMRDYCTENGYSLDAVVSDLSQIGVNGHSLARSDHGGYASYDQYLYVQRYMYQYEVIFTCYGKKFPVEKKHGDYGTLNECMDGITNEKDFSWVDTFLDKSPVSFVLGFQAADFIFMSKDELANKWNVVVKTDSYANESQAADQKYETELIATMFEITQEEIDAARPIVQQAHDKTGKNEVSDDTVYSYLLYQKMGYYTGNLDTGRYGTNILFGDTDEWANLNNYLYHKRDGELIDTNSQGRKVGLIEGYFSEWVASMAEDFVEWQCSWKVDMTIEGLVYGRMSASYTGNADITHFGMEANNPYGVVSAIVYDALRIIIFTIMPIIILAMLIGMVIKNDKKDRANFKEFIYKVVMIYLLIYIMPYAINLLVYVRDAALYFTKNRIAFMLYALDLRESASGFGFVTTFRDLYNDTETLTNAFFYLASSAMFLFFLGYYIAIACLLAVCFALFPLIAFMSIWNKRILTDWFNIFFPNFMMPFIDMVLIFLPAGIMSVWVKVLGESGTATSIAVIEMFVIFATLKVRQRAVKLLGFDGMGGGNGAGLIGAAMMLSRAFGGGRKPERKPEHSHNGAPVGAAVSASGMSSVEAATRGEVLNDMNSNLSDIGSKIGGEVEGWQDFRNTGDSSETTRFLNGLDGGEMERYNNLAKMDAAQTEYDRLSKNTDGLLSSDDYRNMQGIVSENERAAFNASAELKKMGFVDPSDADKVAQKAELERKMESANNKVMQAKEMMKPNDLRNERLQDLKKQIDERRGLEYQYANAEKTVGMRGSAYGSAQDFRMQKKVDDAKKNLADYKNFDSSSFRGVLTPKEQENFLKQREHAQRMETARETASKIVGGAARAATTTAAIGAGVAGFAGGMYGGPSTMANVAVAGGKATKMAGDGLTGLGSGAVNLANRAQQRIVDAGNVRSGNVRYGRRPENVNVNNTQPPTTRDVLYEKAGKGVWDKKDYSN